jgi:tRNA(fMet)-specific endonuclease VapC
MRGSARSLSGKGRPSAQAIIAAQALAINAILVTDNEREFSRVPGLTVENWLADSTS